MEILSACFIGLAKLKKKSTKMITFKDKIEQHDLDSKLNNIRKWLSKGHLVKASITNVSKDEKKGVMEKLLILN
jgi:translation initiation factor IF-3